MFQDVPEYSEMFRSGMFHVPNFIDALNTYALTSPPLAQEYLLFVPLSSLVFRETDSHSIVKTFK